jgi:hypothetical protein
VISHCQQEKRKKKWTHHISSISSMNKPKQIMFCSVYNFVLREQNRRTHLIPTSELGWCRM